MYSRLASFTQAYVHSSMQEEPPLLPQKFTKHFPLTVQKKPSPMDLMWWPFAKKQLYKSTNPSSKGDNSVYTKLTISIIQES